MAATRPRCARTVAEVQTNSLGDARHGELPGGEPQSTKRHDGVRMSEKRATHQVPTARRARCEHERGVQHLAALRVAQFRLPASGDRFSANQAVPACSSALSLRARTHTARRRARGVKCTSCGARRGVQGSQNANRGAGAQACNIRVGRTTDDATDDAGLFFRWPRRAPPPSVARVVDTAALCQQSANLRAQHARSFRRQGCAAWRGNDHALLAP